MAYCRFHGDGVPVICGECYDERCAEVKACDARAARFDAENSALKSDRKTLENINGEYVTQMTTLRASAELDRRAVASLENSALVWRERAFDAEAKLEQSKNWVEIQAAQEKLAALSSKLGEAVRRIAELEAK